MALFSRGTTLGQASEWAFWSVLSALLSFPAAATVFTVAPDGSGAHATIQDAINVATDGDVILLAPGRYQGEGNRDLDMSGKALVVQSQYGEPTACVIDVQGEEGDCHRGFDFHSGEGPGSVIFGITITGGWTSENIGDDGGGGIRILNGSSPTIGVCRLENNRAGVGGGIYSWLSSPTIDHCEFIGNTAVNAGGGMSCHGGDPTVRDCLFVGNDASLGGGLDFWFTDGTVSGSVFAANTATGEGGGVLIGQRDTALSYCTFYGNHGSQGSAIAIGVAACVQLSNCLICYNHPGFAVSCEEGGEVLAECANVFGNLQGDWVDCLSGLAGQDGNISLDPFFCASDATGALDWTIRDDSPCAPDASDCGLIGAQDVGCQGTPVNRVTWGGLKARFR